MFRSRRSRVLAAGGILTLLLAPLAMATAGRAAACHGGSLDPERAAALLQDRVDDLLDEVDATDAQRAEIAGILADAAPLAIDLKRRADEAHAGMREALRGGADAAEVEARRQEAAVLFDEATAAATERVLAVRAVLDASQWEALVALHDRHASWGPPWAHHGGFGWRP